MGIQPFIEMDIQPFIEMDKDRGTFVLGTSFPFPHCCPHVFLLLDAKSVKVHCNPPVLLALSP